MKNKILLIVFSFLFSILIILFLELITSFFPPKINRQDTQLSLFREKAFGNSVGWKPNAKGTSFDAEVFIDEFGFRKMTVPYKSNVSWLILGDSITFGVGVKTDDTFIGMLQKRFPNIRIWNTCVVGYSVENYKDVINYFIEPEREIKKVLLFFSLNDIYGGLNVQPKVGGWRAIFFFLKRNSKFYMLVKNLLFDRSKAYFLYDYNLYDESNPQFKKAMKTLEEINNQLKSKGIGFTIVILPYEYQLREKKDKYLNPQKLVKQHFKENGISNIDVYEYFSSLNKDSKEFYLYADAMHFSKIGHKIVFDALCDKLDGK